MSAAVLNYHLPGRGGTESKGSVGCCHLLACVTSGDRILQTRGIFMEHHHAVCDNS